MSKEIEINVWGLGCVTALWSLDFDAFRLMMADCLRFNRFVRVEIVGLGITYINPAHIRYYKVK